MGFGVHSSTDSGDFGFREQRRWHNNKKLFKRKIWGGDFIGERISKKSRDIRGEEISSVAISIELDLQIFVFGLFGQKASSSFDSDHLHEVLQKHLSQVKRRVRWVDQVKGNPQSDLQRKIPWLTHQPIQLISSILSSSKTQSLRTQSSPRINWRQH